MFFKRSRQRSTDINDAVFKNMVGLFRLRRIQLLRNNVECICSYVITLRNNVPITVNEQTLILKDILEKALNEDEALRCEHGCFTVTSEGYKLYYCLEAYKNSAENLYYVSDAQVVRRPLNRTGVESVTRRLKRLLERNRLHLNPFSEISAGMNEDKYAEEYPNPADRYVAIVLKYIYRLSTKTLYALITEKKFDPRRVKEFIRRNSIGRRAVTDAVLTMCCEGEYVYDSFIHDNGREPVAGELITHDWETRFATLVECGLDLEMQFESNRWSDSILESLWYVDDRDMGARIVRLLFEKLGIPKRLTADGIPYFDYVDSDFVTDIGLGLYEDNKQLYDRAFRFWALFVGFGAQRSDGAEVIRMMNGYDRAILKEYERLCYEEIRREGELILRIFIKDTGETVAETDVA